MSVWLLVVLFVHRGLIVDRPSVYVDPAPYKSSAACQDAYRKYLAAYADTYNGVCQEVRALATPGAK